MAARNEFEIIAEIFRPLSQGDPLAFDLLDDAAMVAVPESCDLVVTKDALVARVHFLESDPPDRVARKLLRVNISDLAAKGARPLSYALACAWPRNLDVNWIEQFAQGLASDQAEFDIHLLGGDTVSTGGEMTLSVTAFGAVPKGKFIERKGAVAGDRIWVTGTIGDAALGLELLQDKRKVENYTDRAFLKERYQIPEPRVSVGQALIGIATSCIDVSDGLVADAEHVAERSEVQLVIEMNTVPISQSALTCHPDTTWLIGAGDDYELLFTAPLSRTDDVLRLSTKTGIAIAAIGTVEEGTGVVVKDEDGDPISIPRTGYQHFD